jgi:hypothetical protein
MVDFTNFQKDTPESIKNEKRALLAAIAEFGTEGKVEFSKAKSEAEKIRESSNELAAARGSAINAPEALNSELTTNFDDQLGRLDNNLLDAEIGHGREIDRISAANAAFLDQISAASVLNKDLLDKQLLGLGSSGGGGGGGGGGGSRGGSSSRRGSGGSSGGFSIDNTQAVRDLEEAGALAGGSADPGILAASGSGARRMFGQAGIPAQEQTFGNPNFIAIREELESMRRAGATPSQIGDALDALVDAKNQDGQFLYSPHQRSFALATMDNYLGLTSAGQRGAATAQDYSVYPNVPTYEDANPYTQAGRDLESSTSSTGFQDAISAAENNARVQVPPSQRNAQAAQRQSTNDLIDEAIQRALASRKSKETADIAEVFSNAQLPELNPRRQTKSRSKPVPKRKPSKPKSTTKPPSQRNATSTARGGAAGIAAARRAAASRAARSVAAAKKRRRKAPAKRQGGPQ